MKKFQTIGLMSALVLLVAVVPWAVGQQLSSKEAKDLCVEAQRIVNEQPPFKIELWTEEGRPRYGIGDSVTFLFKAERDCYVTLIDIGTSGKVTKIFPNVWHDSNFVKAGQVYRIPPPSQQFRFKIEGPGGMEYVKAIATLDPLQSIAKAQIIPKGNFAQFQQPALLLKDIGTELVAAGAQRWSEAGLSFEIVSGPPTAVETPLKIRLWTDGKVYRIGDTIKFNFETDRPCCLTLIDIGSSGSVRIIFPNQYAASNQIQPGKVYRMPPDGMEAQFAYRVVGPPGTNTIKAIATVDPCPLFPSEVPFKSAVYPDLGSKDKVLKDISVALSPLKPAQFVETEVAIEIR